jgi:hypothetical protein
MKFDELDKKLIVSRPDKYKSSSRFTDAVMTRLTNNEIFSLSIRNMNVTKQETFMTRIKHLPAFAIIAIVIASLMIVSGGAYAAYQLLWPKPNVHVSEPVTSVSGRKEVAISLAQCGKTNLASQYELKKNAPITIEEVPMVIKAHCELNAIGTWADKAFPHDGPFTTDKEHDNTHLSVSMATHIKSKDNSSITFAGLTKYNQTDTTLGVTPSTRFIADGHDVTANIITPNDPVIYVTSDVPNSDCNEEHCSISSTQPIKTLVAVVKLSLPFQYYDQFAWQSLKERTP